jgi:broad specificity phosphatase PhoE
MTQLNWQPPKRRRLYLMRHGSVDYFDAAGKPVPPDTVPLNATGREQARAAGELFAQSGVRFDKVVISGLLRTEQTAQALIAATAFTGAMERIEALQEIRPGRIGDIAPEQLVHAFTHAFAGASDPSSQFLGGETIGQLQARALPAFQALMNDPAWHTLLLVLHGGVNRALLGQMLTGTPSFLGAIEQTPACINVIDVGAENDAQRYVVRGINLSPTQWLQTNDRLTTMEKLLAEFIRD